MRRTWPLLVSLALIGLIAGTAVAGGKEASERVVVLTPTSLPAYLTVPAGQAATLPPVDTVDVPIEPARTPEISVDLPVDTTIVTTTFLASEAPVTTVPPIVQATVPPVITIAPPAAEAPPVTDDIPIIPNEPATTVVIEPGARTNLRVVIANANANRNAPRIAYQLYAIGYETVTSGEASGLLDVTTIYYRDGFQDDAVMVAQDMGMPNATLAPMPVNTTAPLTDSDAQGDVIVLLGADAPA